MRFSANPIYKDEDYNQEKDPEAYNMVVIHTARNGKWVDDTEDTHCLDGSLEKELERIDEYRDFGAL